MARARSLESTLACRYALGHVSWMPGGDERSTLILPHTQAVALTDLQILTLAPLLLDLLAREEALQQLAPLLAGGELGGGLIERVLEGG